MHIFTQNTSSNSLNSAAMQNFYLKDKKVKTESLCNLPIGTLLTKKDLEFKSLYIRGGWWKKNGIFPRSKSLLVKDARCF